MRHLLNFLLKYDYCVLFILLQTICLTLLIRFNSYQASVFFTSASRVAGWAYDISSQVTRYFGLERVNRDLTARNTELELQVAALQRELQQYVRDTSDIAGLKREFLKGYRMYPARVVNNSLAYTDNYITINKGKADGICPEMGVVCGVGIVGIVYLVSEHHALVLPVLNSKSNISCKVRRTSYFGLLKWEGGSSQYACVRDIPRHSEFTLGDTIVTSGHSAVFPEGVPIGTVDDMQDSRDGLSYLLRVRLFTDFACLNDVIVISPIEREEQSALEDNINIYN